MAAKDIKFRISPEEIARAPLEVARKKGTGSFVLDILGAPLTRRPALSEAVGKYRLGLRRGDIAAGEALAEKVPALKGLLGTEIRTPIKEGPGGLVVTHVAKAKRLSAPLVKAQKFVVPILAYEALRRIGQKSAEEKNMTREEQAVLMKAANLIEKLGQQNDALVGMLAKALHEKGAHKLAHSMAERGLIQLEDVEKKASELSKEEDLGIVKKAVDLAQNGFEMGHVETVSVEGSEDDLDPMTEYLVGHIQGR